jgi:hypothetical protein
MPSAAAFRAKRAKKSNSFYGAICGSGAGPQSAPYYFLKTTKSLRNILKKAGVKGGGTVKKFYLAKAASVLKARGKVAAQNYLGEKLGRRRTKNRNRKRARSQRRATALEGSAVTF